MKQGRGLPTCQSQQLVTNKDGCLELACVERCLAPLAQGRLHLAMVLVASQRHGEVQRVLRSPHNAKSAINKRQNGELMQLMCQNVDVQWGVVKDVLHQV